MSPDPEAPKIALAGNPNCGKTALFNALTGGRQKVANYPGVTVERKEGAVIAPSGLRLNLLDLPGTCSLDARTPDEIIARDVILGVHENESTPQVLIAVVDATNLERGLGLVMELRELKVPVVLALNMMDLAAQRGLDLDVDILSRELGVPVVPTVAVKREGISELLKEVERQLGRKAGQAPGPDKPAVWTRPSPGAVRDRFKEVDRIVHAATKKAALPNLWTDRVDRIVLHPLWGSLLFIAVMVLMFQSIFNWATIPQDWIKSAMEALGRVVEWQMADGPLRSLIVDGAISGVGSVLVFLPQILLLFLFILVLEDSGYMSRAAFLMDRLMGKVGLNGRAFIPLLSSYACAIPGIMATRTIANRRDRLTTILVAPLTTCSARLPVYSLLIAAFIPNRAVLGPLRLQGLVMFGLYVLGISAALGMALIFRGTIFRGPKPTLLMEMPTYKVPDLRSIGVGLLERSKLFLRRAGTVILASAVLLWFLASYPKAPLGAEGAPISYSYAGKIGHAIEPVLRPLGFDWRISVALIPGLAAREVMVSALGTVFAIEGDKDTRIQALGGALAKGWSLATALSLLIWYVMSCQCLSTLAVTRRETNSWRWPAVMFGYMTALAYICSFLTFHIATALGWG